MMLFTETHTEKKVFLLSDIFFFFAKEEILNRVLYYTISLKWLTLFRTVYFFNLR